MNQADDLPSRPHPLLHIPTLKHPPAPDPTDQFPHILKHHILPLLPLNPHRLLRHLIPIQPRRIPKTPQHQLRIPLASLHNRPLDIEMNRRFDRTHEPGPHIDAFGAQRQRSRQAVAIREAATRHEGGITKDLAGAAQQNKIGDVGLADMAGALEAIDAQEIDAEADGRFRVPDRGALVDDDAAGLLEQPDHGARRVARRFHDPDPAVDDGLRVGEVVGRVERGQEREVDAERVRGQDAGAGDFGGQVRGGRLGQGGEDAEAAGVGDGGGEGGESHPLHAALDDGDADLEGGGEAGGEGHGGPVLVRNWRIRRDRKDPTDVDQLIFIQRYI